MRELKNNGGAKVKIKTNKWGFLILLLMKSEKFLYLKRKKLAVGLVRWEKLVPIYL